MQSINPEPPKRISTKEIFLCTHAGAYAAYAVLAFGALLVQKNAPDFNIFVHGFAVLISPFFALTVRNRRIEVEGNRLRSINWRGRVITEIHLDEIEAIILANGEELGFRFRFKAGFIPFEHVRNRRKLANRVSELTGLPVRSKGFFIEI